MVMKWRAYAIHLGFGPPLSQNQELHLSVHCKIRYLQNYFKKILDKCFVNISECNIQNEPSVEKIYKQRNVVGGGNLS